MTGDDPLAAAVERVKRLPIWHGPVEPQRLTGGITNNTNFVVKDDGRRYVVRIGQDLPVHQIVRSNEREATKAASAAGASPEVVLAEDGVLVIRFIEGRTCTGPDLQQPGALPKVLDLIGRVHHGMLDYLRGPVLTFWPFYVFRDYAHTLRDDGSRYLAKLPELMDVSTELERGVGPVAMVFCHNDLLAANFIDDGSRLWLVDWDYAGFNSPLFDLANLSTNNLFGAEAEDWMLAAYFGGAPDDQLRKSYDAMKCASLLRETLWGMVSEIHSKLDYDYPAYTQEFMDRFSRTLADYRRKWA
jgi:thiamine kinase-like enzyme